MKSEFAGVLLEKSDNYDSANDIWQRVKVKKKKIPSQKCILYKIINGVNEQNAIVATTSRVGNKKTFASPNKRACFAKHNIKRQFHAATA